MAISKKILMIAFMATTISFATCSGEQQPENTKAFDFAQYLKSSGDFLAGSLKNTDYSYEELSKKVHPYCNPTSMTIIGLSGVCLKFRSFAALTTGFLLAIYSKNISDVIEKEIALNTLNNNQDSKLETGKTNTEVIIFDQNQSDSGQKPE